MQKLEHTTAPNWLQYVMGILIVFLTLALLFGWFMPEVPDMPVMPDVPTAAAIAAAIVIPEVVIPNSSSTQLETIFKEITEDEDWEDEMEELATEEWEERDYRDLERAINEFFEHKIDDGDDVEYVREDDSSRFRRIDADDRDGVIRQFLKIKYEDENGDDRKVYLTVKSEFDDGDLDDQEIFPTND